MKLSLLQKQGQIQASTKNTDSPLIHDRRSEGMQSVVQQQPSMGSSDISNGTLHARLLALESKVESNSQKLDRLLSLHSDRSMSVLTMALLPAAVSMLMSSVAP